METVTVEPEELETVAGLSAVLAKEPAESMTGSRRRYPDRVGDIGQRRRILGRRPNGSIRGIGIIDVRRAGRRSAAPVDSVRLVSRKIALSDVDRRRVGAGRGERRVLVVDVKSSVEILFDGVLVADREAHARIAVTSAAHACDILRHASRVVAAVRRLSQPKWPGPTLFLLSLSWRLKIAGSSKAE